MNTSEHVQLLHFVAAAKAVQPGRLLRSFVLQYMCLTSERFFSKEDIRRGLKRFFAFDVSKEELELLLKDLASEKVVSVSARDGRYEVREDRVSGIRQQIDEARKLEAAVKKTWLAAIASEWPSLAPEQLWAALQQYLSAAFRRHGLQAAMFLFPKADFGNDDALNASLTELLESAVNDLGAHSDAATTAISSFMTHAPDDLDRRKYLQQLADGAMLFYSYTAPPESAELIRRKLETVTLVLDTNFLFGILDLHANPYVAASRELIRIRDEGLPLKLVYHPATAVEFKSSIAYWAGELKKDEPYPQQLSRASLESTYVSGIVRRYHETNARLMTPVSEFLRRYTNVDLLLPTKGIDVWETSASTPSAQLFAEYATYLKETAERRREAGLPKLLPRTEKTQRHDIVLLDAVIAARGDGQSNFSTLVLLTCDYHLYAFDHHNARQHKRSPCTVLPNIFWQALRACVAPSPNFDRSFAAVFAIPEFRSISSTASDTSVRVLGYLASLYRDLNEDVAARLLSSAALMERLRDEPDQELRSEIDRAIDEEEQALLEDRTAALQAERKEVETLKERLEATQRELLALKAPKPVEVRLQNEPNDDRLRLVGAVILGSVVTVFGAVAIRSVAGWIGWDWFLALRALNQILALAGMLLGTLCALAFLPSEKRSGLIVALIWGVILAFVSWVFSVLPPQEKPNVGAAKSAAQRAR